MYKLKERSPIDQQVTIYDFVRLWFDDCGLQELDRSQPFGFFSSGKWQLTGEEEEKKILKFGLQPKYTKTMSFQFLTLLLSEITNDDSGFPLPIQTTFVKNKFINTSNFGFYLVSDIVDWLVVNLVDLEKQVMPTWARQYIDDKNNIEHRSRNSHLENSKMFYLKELPKFLQLLIRTHYTTDWKTSPDNKAIYKIAIDIAKNELEIPNTPELKGSGLNFTFPNKDDNDVKSMSKKLMEVLPKIIKPDNN
jgi:hypothetical protein